MTNIFRITSFGPLSTQLVVGESTANKKTGFSPIIHSWYDLKDGGNDKIFMYNKFIVKTYKNM